MLVLLSALAVLIILVAIKQDAGELFDRPISIARVLSWFFCSSAAIFLLGFYFSGIPGPGWSGLILTSTLGSSYLIVAVNRRYLALKFFVAFGAAMNGVAVAMNGWRMPMVYFQPASMSWLTIYPVRLIALADFINSPLVGLGIYWSVGDLIMMLAVVWTAGKLVVYSQKAP